MVKKILIFFSMGLFALGMAGCSSSGHAGSVSVQTGPAEELPEQEVMCAIRIRLGDTVLDGVLYDNPTAQGFAEMLPVTTETWHAAPGFARAFDLTEQIEQKGTPGYGYEPGSLAYWDEGPSIAMIYAASRRETVVPVVPIGKMTSDASMLEEYEDIITIELVEDEESLSGTGGTLTENSGGMTENGGVAGGNETVFTADTKVWDVIHDPVFGDYGRLIFPADRSISDSLTLGDVGNILTWYSYVSHERTVEIANYLREQAALGEQIFYDIYTEEEKAADPAKEAEGTSQQELTESRSHRAFAGFSMGSVTTWHTFQYCMDYFRYFLPSSGNLTSDGAYMERLVTEAGYGSEDFFIYAMSGTEDFAYAAFTNQIQAMINAPGGIFVDADNERAGNLAYRVQEGNAHDGNAALQYIYNGLIWLRAEEK